MNASGRRHPWPSLAFMLVLTTGALLRDPTPAAAQTTDAAAMRDVAYGSHPQQVFDVFLPADPRDAPTIFYVHGGGWQHGDKATGIGTKAARWTAAGAIVISTNYRLVPDADPMEQARDVARSVAKAQALVAERGGDPTSFVLMGHSAGAHLVALLAASPSMARESGATPWRASVLLDSGAVDVVATMHKPLDKPLFERAFGHDAAFWRAASPLHRLQAKTAPILAVCAQERPDSCPNNRTFVDRARGLGGHAELLPKPLSHMEINRDLGEDNDYTREVEAFLRGVGVPLRG
ncbi:MAG: alpha/beta hydrolase [Lysobacteraceae bacterium]